MAERVGRYEHRDVPAGGLLRVVLPLGVLLLVLTGLLLLFGRALDWLTERAPAPALEQLELVPPPPRLQARPELELEAVRARERRLLQGYGWVDPEAGIARVPIERAMAILAERGWPNPVAGPVAWPAPPVPVTAAKQPAAGAERDP